jgi:hypothetical protein
MEVNMRLLSTVVFFIVVAVLPLSAQTTFDDFRDSYQQFADGVANSLPFNALSGLTWSDAYIGNFPHFGAGGTLGFVTMPYAAVEPVFDAIGATSSVPDAIKAIGMPMPLWCAEGRIGGFGFPFDIGIKLGYLPEGFVLPGTTNVLVDYLLTGIDFRWGVLEGGLAIPAVSVGGGIHYLKGNAFFEGITGGNVEIANIDTGAGTWSVQATDPDVNFNFEALVFDMKAQASWNVLILTPYLGAGVSYAPYAKAGGGLRSDIEVDTGSGYQPISSTEIDQIKAAYPDVFSDLSDTSFIVTAEMPPTWSLRVFGGFSFNILVVKLDITGMYNLLDGAFGATVGVRVQL